MLQSGTIHKVNANDITAFNDGEPTIAKRKNGMAGVNTGNDAADLQPRSYPKVDGQTAVDPRVIFTGSRE